MSVPSPQPDEETAIAVVGAHLFTTVYRLTLTAIPTNHVVTMFARTQWLDHGSKVVLRSREDGRAGIAFQAPIGVQQGVSANIESRTRCTATVASFTVKSNTLRAGSQWLSRPTVSDHLKSGAVRRTAVLACFHRGQELPVVPSKTEVIIDTTVPTFT